ncbi:hypothetical protein A3D25_05145 [Candidatus Daviesbacteria bacterium RIFCSPHIGHO2_02_FULL_43_12]|uniref:Uncharacterized protein n=1 Tax=Candidatus Daviesbacteria bacterium RIFCSPHIGHO2_02_FULL_43_12 TaxID=1797776 RepID=A0A1F5KIW4_9BACT|nr:MAG: hypothetical protein A3D25_05145 [Candidatus Daviesbacteria bacterium RIFCSPHIGHO2_02_FULL_43_12]
MTIRHASRRFSYKTADNVLTFASDAKEAFTERGQHARKVILSALGSNLLLKDKIVSIDTDSALLPMILVSNSGSDNLDTFEPPKHGPMKGKSAAFGDANPNWLRALHAFRTAIWQIPGNISPFKIVNYW